MFWSKRCVEDIWLVWRNMVEFHKEVLQGSFDVEILFKTSNVRNNVPFITLILCPKILGMRMLEDLPITGFNSGGYPIYPAKHNGHFLWDVPGSGMCDLNCPCWDDWEDDDDYATKKKPKKKKPPIFCQPYQPKFPKDPPPPPAPLPIYKKELKWIAKHCKSELPSPIPHSTPIVQPIACMMFSSTSSDYPSSFLPLEPHTDSQRNVVSKPLSLQPLPPLAT